MSKSILVSEMMDLQQKMHGVASLMEQQAEEHYMQHGIQLHNAAEMIGEWIEGIQEEVESEIYTESAG